MNITLTQHLCQNYLFDGVEVFNVLKQKWCKEMCQLIQYHLIFHEGWCTDNFLLIAVIKVRRLQIVHVMDLN